MGKFQYGKFKQFRDFLASWTSADWKSKFVFEGKHGESDILSRESLILSQCWWIDFLTIQAISNLEKALTLEPPNTKWAGAVHKWLAIGVMRLKDISSPVSPSHPYVKKYNKQLLEHLEKAVKLDSNDAFAYHYLGLL